MRTSWRIGRIFGIEIFIDSSWLIIFALITWSLSSFYFPHYHPGWSVRMYWLIGVTTSIIFFMSVLIHELAHSLVAKKQGEEVRNITLFIFGGAAQIADEPDRPSKEFRMAIVGPLTSIALAVVFGIIWLIAREINQPLAALTRYVAFINVMLALFNLLPGFPLDGGRVLRSIVWGATGNFRRATRIATWAGQVLAFIFIVWGIIQVFAGSFIGGLWIAFIGWFLHSAASRSYHQVFLREMLRGVRAKDLMTTDFKTVTGNMSVQKLIDEYVLHHAGHAFLVAENGHIEGIVCLEDIKVVPQEKRATTLVREVMTRKEELATAAPEEDGNVILSRLGSRDVGQLPVIERGQVIGILCRSDILRNLQLRTELGI
ncbi:MAG: site-2 protease family protein [Gemmatimonadota bacterium]|nr:MAG: site-2 protease family protein [Gemmatimonadota bacterium]